MSEHRSEEVRSVMKVGFLATQNAFVLETLKRLQLANLPDEFCSWEPGQTVPSTDLEVIIAIGKVDSTVIGAQGKLGLVQMASAGYEEVDVVSATKAGVWVGSAPTTKTGNRESVAELAVLLMIAASRRLNEELAFTHGGAGCSATIWVRSLRRTEEPYWRSQRVDDCRG